MFRRFFKDESGQGMVEYALIIALIAVVVIVALTTLGQGISDKFDAVNEKLGATGGESDSGTNRS